MNRSMMASSDDESAGLPTSGDYANMVSSRAYIRLSGWTTVRLTGSDRVDFLQSFCTNDLRRVGIGQGCEALLLNVKGKIVAHVVALIGRDEALLLAGPDQGDRIVSHLDRYVIREDVTLADVSEASDWRLLNRSAAEALAPELLPRLTSPWTHESFQLDAAETLGVRAAMTWLEAYLFRGPAEQADAWETRLAAAGAVAASADAWETLRIESGWPMFGRDFDAEMLPQELGRDSQAISLTKGCYLGQETVARIDALGHVNKRLATLRFNGTSPPEIDAALTSGDAAAGRVTSACWSPQLAAPVALAMVRRGHERQGAKLDSEAGAAEVIATPAVSAATAEGS